MTQIIRVVVANQPRLMRELVLEAITEQPDIEIVAEIQDESEILTAVDNTHPDFLIIALDELQPPSRCVRHASSSLSRDQDFGPCPGTEQQHLLLGFLRYSFRRG